MQTLKPVVRRGVPLNHNETLVPVVRQASSCRTTTRR